jgi:hypothetical protein
MILVRGAGDISFVAEYVDGLDGLGTMGGGSIHKRIYGVRPL